MSTGSITYGERKYYARSLQEFESLDDIGNVALTTATGNKVPLKNVADISEDYKDLDQITRTNGSPAVGIHVQKETDANTVEACTAVKEEMDKIKTELGGKVDVKIVMDQSDFINKSINSTAKTLVEGSILAVLIILLVSAQHSQYGHYRDSDSSFHRCHIYPDVLYRQHPEHFYPGRSGPGGGANGR